YHSPAIELPVIDPKDYLPKRLRRLCGDVVMRPLRPITDKLSPARVVTDLYGLRGAEVVPRPDGEWERAEGDVAAAIRLTLAAHFWPADFTRAFGAGFYRELMLPAGAISRRIVIQGHKTPSFKEAGRAFADPVLGYLRVKGRLHPLR